MKQADTFPKFCPNCGQKRELVEAPAEWERLAYDGELVLVSHLGFGKPENFYKSVEQNNLTEKNKDNSKNDSKWQDTEYCTRCGFRWESIADPSSALSQRLQDLKTPDLWYVMTFFHPVFKDLIATTAKTVLNPDTGKPFDMSHVFRVMDGQRKNQQIQNALVGEFRKRLQATGVDKLI